MAKEKQDHSLLIMGIVGIVAIVGIIGMVNSVPTQTSVVSDGISLPSANLTGQAYGGGCSCDTRDGGSSFRWSSTLRCSYPGHGSQEVWYNFGGDNCDGDLVNFCYGYGDDHPTCKLAVQ